MLLNSGMSDLMDVIMGVPWGSICGPLLFMLIVNELTGQCSELTEDLSADGNTPRVRVIRHRVNTEAVLFRLQVELLEISQAFGHSI